ncbi:hypothetical protein TNCV_661841 [Trichonephila clavipes]|nr:hypothetical protein TNCV_661841 [Trichonephila clavipes]
MPDEEVINNDKTRKAEERVQRNPCHWRSCSYVNPTPLAHADTSRDVLPRGGTSQETWLSKGSGRNGCFEELIGGMKAIGDQGAQKGNKIGWL